MKWWWLAMVAAGCGRISFDERGDGGTGGGGSGNGSGGGSGSLMCPAVPNCPDDTLILTDAPSDSDTNTVMTDHGLSSAMCRSGNGNPETAWLVMTDLPAPSRYRRRRPRPRSTSRTAVVAGPS